MRRIVPVILALVLLGAVLLLREASISRHEPVPASSVMEVVVHAKTKGGERGQTLEEMTEAIVLSCRLEVTSDPVGGLERLAGDRFAFVLQPSLDATDRRQFRGCLEDWRVDHVQLGVLSMTERLDAPQDATGG